MLPDEIRRLFRAPFHTDRFGMFIHDAENNVLCDFNGDRNTFRTRGWGRFAYLPEGERLHDLLSAFMEGFVNAGGFQKDPKGLVEALNRLWRTEQ